jgi:hypothetical protein
MGSDLESTARGLEPLPPSLDMFFGGFGGFPANSRGQDEARCTFA